MISLRDRFTNNSCSAGVFP